MQSLGISGAYLHTPRVFDDERGSFLEWFRGGELAETLGHRFETAQGNISVSRRGALRGVHFSDVPPGQAKYVTCVTGAILDVILDGRVGSPTFGQWEAVELTGRNRRGVYLAEGLGHGFMALADDTAVAYLCSTGYNPGAEHGIHPQDPDLAIGWPAGIEPILSAKDAAAPTFKQAAEAGMLPTLAACEQYAASLRA